MKGFIFALHLLGLLQLGKSQTACTLDVAVPIDASSSSDSGTGSDDGSGNIALDSIAEEGADAAATLAVRKRDDTLECTSSETCYTVNDGLLCVDDTTNDFHLADGTIGNLDTGDYTLPDGDEGNLYTDPTSDSAAGASTTFDASAASATDAFATTDAGGSADFSTTAAASASATDTPSETADSSFAAETEASSSSTRTSHAESTSAAETETSSSSTRTSHTTSPTSSPTSVRVLGGAAARYSNSNLVLLAAMGLGAIF